MIKSITMENIKRQSCEQSLTGRDLIVGPNGSGKTTRMQTLGIAMLGYVPGADKLPAETFKLCSNNKEMTAGLTLDNFIFSRAFEKTVKENKKTGATEVKISQEISLSPGMGEANTTQKEARIMAEIGNFPVMLNFGDFVSMSDAQRRKFIYNLSPVKVENWDLEKISNYISDKLLTLDLKTNNPDKYAYTHKAITEVIGSYPKGFDVQAGLVSMIDFAKKKLSYWGEQRDQADGAAKKLSELKNQLLETDRNIAANKSEQEEVQKKLTDITAQIASDQQKIIANKKRQDSINELTVSINNLNASKNPWVLSELQASLLATKEKLAGDGKDYKAERDGLQKQIDESNRLVTEKQNSLDELLSDPVEKQASNQLAVYRSTLKTISEISPEDPRCIISHAIGCNKNFTAYKTTAEEKMGELESIIKANEDSRTELNKSIAELNQKKNKAQNDINQSHIDEKQEMSRVQKVKEEISTIENNIKTAESFDSNKAVRIKEKQDALDKLNESPIAAVADINAATILQTSYSNRIVTLKSTISGQEAAKTTISNQQKSMIDNKSAGYFADAFKFISDALGAKGIQGEIVKSILDPIRIDIQDKFNQLGIPHSFYFTMESDTGKEVFQFGWAETVEDRFDGPKQLYKNFDALSTGEQVLFASALLITIIERSNPKLKVLTIDNLNDLDEINFPKVMHGLSVIGGNMDNIILAGVVGQYLKKYPNEPEKHDLVEYYEGFKVWELAK